MMNIPQHIVLFPDGNRRWAKSKGLDKFLGHQQGYRNLIDFSILCNKKGVKVLTAFGFSTENWKRSSEEVTYLMQLLEQGLDDSQERFMRENIRVQIIGQKEKLPVSLQKTIQNVETSTKKNVGMCLNLAISYGGKWDIVNAVKNMMKEGIASEQVTEEIFEKYLSTAGQVLPDLVIRAGGEQRLSNFVLWQAAYAELYFSSKMWPDFQEQDLELAFQEFDNRSRRFGK
jgi:undecaprenyl diphosphate synthase